MANGRDLGRRRLTIGWLPAAHPGSHPASYGCRIEETAGDSGDTEQQHEHRRGGLFAAREASRPPLYMVASLSS